MNEINLNEHKEEIERLIKYIPWLESKQGEIVSRIYSDNNLGGTSVTFPVYDGTLMSFVKEASETGLMFENYLYVYSALAIRSVADEKKAIEEAGVKDGKVLCGILSKYIKGGMTRGSVWTEAVKEGIFVLVLKKMKQLLEIWDAPLA